MSTKIKDLLKNISYSIFANGISLIISILITLFVPKIIGVTEYGYLQLFIFYSSYIGFFHFGICDGIYLKYGGRKLCDVSKTEFTSQFIFLVIIEIIISFIITIFAIYSNNNFEKDFVIICTAISLILVIPKLLCIYVLQACNEIKKYSILLLIERIVYGTLTILFLVFLKKNIYCWIIFADLFGKLIASILAVFYCRILFIKEKIKITFVLAKIYENFSIGSKLLLANLATLLIIGIVRMNIENHWGIDVFAKVSLALSISSFVLTFISAIGIAIFPILKRSSVAQYKDIYKHIDFILSIFLFFILIFYFPGSKILVLWLPKYEESVLFLSILFPIFVYDAKNSLLINTFYKALRLEKELLFINLITVCLSFIGSFICIYYMNNIIITLLFIVILFAFKNFMSEFYISRYLNLKFLLNKVMESILIFFFISVNYLIPDGFNFILYILLYLVYIGLFSINNQNSFVFIKNVILSKLSIKGVE